MKRTSRSLFLIFTALAPLVTAAPEVKFTPVYPGVKCKRPVQVTVPPDGSGRHFLVEQHGLVTILPPVGRQEEPSVFLDLTDRPLIENKFEEGLLNLTFHPEFATNGKVYVYYTIQNPKRSLIAEFLLDQGAPGKVDVDSERVLLEIPQPFWNHNSGNMTFGPDGFLYIAVGDGGKADDYLRLSQNLWTRNGKILRIDIDQKGDGGLAYAIPADNPFVETPGTRPEIWAYGMRNPWGIHFDMQGRLWCADVGQDLWEEINIIEKGKNYGWSYREGKQPFPKRKDAPPEGVEFTDPIHVYGRSDGLSITGGVVYQGEKIPSLKGYYIYGDFQFGTVWALKYEEGKVVENIVLRAPAPKKGFQPTSFCKDKDGEILVTIWNGGIYKIEP